MVLGAGFGGLEDTTGLADEFGDEVHVTLIDKSEAFEMNDNVSRRGGGAVPANQQQTEAWKGPESAHLVAHADCYDRQLERFTQALLEWARPEGHHVVLDVGCGSGASTLAAATWAGRVTGVDFRSRSSNWHGGRWWTWPVRPTTMTNLGEVCRGLGEPRRALA